MGKETYDDGIDFEDGNFQNLKKEENSKNSGLDSSVIVRQAYRVPVGESFSLEVKIDDVVYEIIDIVNSGIGIRVNDESTFDVGEIIDSIHMTFDDASIDVKGKIIHISPYSNKSYYSCGIQFIDLDEVAEKQIAQYVRQKRLNILAKIKYITKNEEDES